MAQTVYHRLLALLSDPRFHDESVDDDLGDSVASLADDVGWPPVLTAMLDVLRDESNAIGTMWLPYYSAATVTNFRCPVVVRTLSHCFMIACGSNPILGLTDVISMTLTTLFGVSSTT